MMVDNKLIHASEATELSWLSLAYIDSGIFMAESIVNDDFSDSSHRALVPLFLIHQGLELLYKSALRAKGICYTKTHNLRTLETEFRKNFPELTFKVPEVILASKSMNEELFPDFDLQAKVQHEKLRYPTDNKCRPWSANDSIDLMGSIEDIVALNKQSMKTWLKVRELTGAT